MGHESKKSCRSQRLGGLRVANPHAAGIDVHSQEHWVAVPPEGAPPAPADQSARLNRADTNAADVRQSLYRVSGVDLTVLEGIDENTALVLLSELGMDMSPWPTVKRLVSWLGLCPQHRGSAGKIRSRHVRRGCNRAARALRLAAQGCHHAKNALGAFYRRLQAGEQDGVRPVAGGDVIED